MLHATQNLVPCGGRAWLSFRSSGVAQPSLALDHTVSSCLEPRDHEEIERLRPCPEGGGGHFSQAMQAKSRGDEKALADDFCEDSHMI